MKKVKVNETLLTDLPFDCIAEITNFLSDAEDMNSILRTCKYFKMALECPTIHSCLNTIFEIYFKKRKDAQPNFYSNIKEKVLYPYVKELVVTWRQNHIRESSHVLQATSTLYAKNFDQFPNLRGLHVNTRVKNAWQERFNLLDECATEKCFETISRKLPNLLHLHVLTRDVLPSDADISKLKNLKELSLSYLPTGNFPYSALLGLQSLSKLVLYNFYVMFFRHDVKRINGSLFFLTRIQEVFAKKLDVLELHWSGADDEGVFIDAVELQVFNFLKACHEYACKGDPFHDKGFQTFECNCGKFRSNNPFRESSGMCQLKGERSMYFRCIECQFCRGCSKILTHSSLPSRSCESCKLSSFCQSCMFYRKQFTYTYYNNGRGHVSFPVKPICPSCDDEKKKLTCSNCEAESPYECFHPQDEIEILDAVGERGGALYARLCRRYSCYFCSGKIDGMDNVCVCCLRLCRFDTYARTLIRPGWTCSLKKKLPKKYMCYWCRGKFLNNEFPHLGLFHKLPEE